MTTTFAELGVRQELAAALAKAGIRRPTPIQEQAIPPLLSGKDLIAQAQTGTGKTLAFLLPILERIEQGRAGVQALIVTPTRELALQITEEAKKLAAVAGADVLAVYGGQDVEAQARKLQGTFPIVVATPGRLLDHLRRGTLQLDRVTMLVLDEADQMLALGFLEEVETILRQTPRDRQTMLFSATMPDAVRRLAAAFMSRPEDVRVRQGSAVTLKAIKQLLAETTDRAKQDRLAELLQQYRPFLAMIFCRTKIRAKTLTQALLARGFNVDELHGDLTQAKREQVMKRFRSADLQLLVATDVAARGLDVEGVTHVFNYDIPHDAESYIHRIGRTGRAGEEGLAITLAAPRDRMYVERIERGIGMKLERMPAEADRGGTEPRGERTPQGRTGGRRPSGRGAGAGGRAPESRAGRKETGRRGAGGASGRRGADRGSGRTDASPGYGTRGGGPNGKKRDESAARSGGGRTGTQRKKPPASRKPGGKGKK